jgi:glycosyltransferase involved in cell wall biosynthesis
LGNAGLDALYAPHGVDCEVFRTGTHLIGGVPARQALGLPDDAFVVGMNAANKGASKIRKGFPQAFAAFGMFVKEHPDAMLFVHTERHGMAQGVQLDRLAQACGIPDANIAFVDQYAYRVGLSQQVVAAMYSGFDVLLAPSMGEGFGIPVVEAQACGVPVIVSDFSAQPELVGSGWAVGGAPDWDEAQAAWLHLPDVGQIVEALRCAYNGEGIPGNARAHAERYDTRLVFDTYWRPILTELERRLVVPDVNIAPVDVSAL